MADPLEHVAPGDGLVIRAETWNAILDSAKRSRETAAGNQLGPRPGLRPPIDRRITPACEVYVRNDTGATLLEWSCVALGTPLISAVDAPFAVREQPLFPATTPAAATDAFAITVEPIADGGIGKAVVLGVVPADVSVSDTGHGYAAPSAGVQVLASGTTGPARILWKDAGTGTQRAVVQLEGTAAASGGGTAPTVTVTIASGAISADNTDTVVCTKSLTAGTYKITAVATAAGSVSTLGDPTLLDGIWIKVRNDTAGADLNPTGYKLAFCPQVTGEEMAGTVTLVHWVTLAVTSTIKVLAQRTNDGTDPVWTDASIRGATGGFGTGESYLLCEKWA